MRRCVHAFGQAWIPFLMISLILDGAACHWQHALSHFEAHQTECDHDHPPEDPRDSSPNGPSTIGAFVDEPACPVTCSEHDSSRRSPCQIRAQSRPSPPLAQRDACEVADLPCSPSLCGHDCDDSAPPCTDPGPCDHELGHEHAQKLMASIKTTRVEPSTVRNVVVRDLPSRGTDIRLNPDPSPPPGPLPLIVTTVLLI